MNKSSQPSYTPELLPVDEYAERLKVSRSTIYEWRNRGKLLAGQHYIKIGRTVRYFWDADIFREIHEINNQEPEVKCKGSDKKIQPNSPINFEY